MNELGPGITSAKRNNNEIIMSYRWWLRNPTNSPVEAGS